MVTISDWQPSLAADAPSAKLRSIRGNSYSDGNPNQHGTYGTQVTALVDRISYAQDFTGSSIVVAGFASREQSYLSSDMLNLYTEWTIRIEQVWLSTGSPALSRGGTISVHREGGALRMPSGEILTARISGIPSPLEPFHRYVLFLRYEAEGSWFRLDKAWKVENERMVPVDRWDSGSQLTGLNLAQFHHAFDDWESKNVTRYQ